MQKIEKRIKELAQADQYNTRPQHELAEKRAELDQVTAERESAKQNLARAKSDEEYEAISAVFNELGKQIESKKKEIAAAEAQTREPRDTEILVQDALEIVRRLTDLDVREDDHGLARQMFELVNARLFVSFQSVQVKRRMLNKVTGGVVTFGAAPPPIQPYEGPTTRRKIKNPTAPVAAEQGGRHLPPPTDSTTGSGEEDKSLGNVNRGDRIWTYDLCVPNAAEFSVQVLEVVLQ